MLNFLPRFFLFISWSCLGAPGASPCRRAGFPSISRASLPIGLEEILTWTNRFSPHPVISDASATSVKSLPPPGTPRPRPDGLRKRCAEPGRLARGHPGRASRQLRAAHPRTASGPRLGFRRNLQFHARRLGSLLFQSEGQRGSGALRVLPAEGPVRRLCVAGRTRRRGARHRVDLRSARRVPAQCRDDAPRRDRRAVREIRTPEGATRGCRMVRRGAQASAAVAAASHRHRDVRCAPRRSPTS